MIVHPFIDAVNMDDQERSPKNAKRRRPYRMQRRASQQAQTRQTLARAAFELHSSVGPSRTTVSAIAELAGVQRLTVYRHFPDQQAIFSACTAYSFAHDPPPNPETWREIANGRERLRRALSELYGYYERKKQLLCNLYRDAELPAVAAALDRRREALASAVSILSETCCGRNERATRLVVAAIGHAVDFHTWQSLTQTQRLSKEESIAAMLLFIQTVGTSSELAEARPNVPQPKRGHNKRL